jgi:HSCB C-terminal oligomerisation domain
MEAREQVEETDNQLELKAIHQSVASSYAQLINKLSSAFRSRDFEYAKQLTVQLRYISKLLEEINKKLPSF